LQSGLTSSGTFTTFNKVTGGFYDQSASTLAATLLFSVALPISGHYTTYEVSKPITLSKWTNAAINSIKQGTTSVTSGYVGIPYTFNTTNAAYISSYRWTYTNGASSFTSTGYSSTVTFPSTGPWTIQLEVHDGCGWSNPVIPPFLFQVYALYSIPNPVSGTLYATRASAAPALSSPSGHYNVMNMMGNVVASGSINLNASSFSVNLSSNPAGIYVIYIYRDSPTTILQTHTFTLSVPL
jgi:hypothetical protein